MTPKKIITISAIFSFLFAAWFLWLTFKTPWMGLEFTLKSHTNGLFIKAVDRNGPAYGVLKPDMQLVAIGNKDLSMVLDRHIFKREPADSASFAIYNQFRRDNQKLYTILGSEEIWLQDSTEQRYKLKPQSYRNLSSLKFDHLAAIVVAALAFVFHVMLANFKKNKISIQVLSITALSYSLHIMIGQTTFFRELVINPLVLDYIHPLQMLTALFYAYFLMGLLCYYPSRLVSKKLVYVLFLLATTFWLNLITQTVELPDNSYLMQFNILYLIALSMAFVQWRKARGSAIKMAQFKWLFLAMQGGTVLNITLNILPQSLGNEPLVGISTVLLFSYIIFIGIALGIYRYKLFNIEKWWFRVWSWFFAGLTVVLLDILFVSLLNIEQQSATIASMLLVGWVYFPIRLRIWKYVSSSPDNRLAEHIPLIISSMATIKTKTDINNALLQTMQNIFNAQHATYTTTPSLQSRLHNSGLSLSLPDITHENTLTLDYADNGARLFTHEDATLATGIAELYKRLHDAIDSKEQGAQEERERIMSDLHDDLGPKLLSLIHKSNNPTVVELAKDSLRSLRDTVYSMQYVQAMPLTELLANERPILTERALEKNKSISWSIDSNLEHIHIRTEAVLHIKRILNELISNELRHGTSKNISITAELMKHHISIRFCSDSTHDLFEEWQKGVGMNNLTRRSKALNGTIQWHRSYNNNINHLCFELLFPNDKRVAA